MKNRDYSKPGAYFITICTFGQVKLFESFKSGQMQKTLAGLLIEDVLSCAGNLQSRVKIEQYCIMPNHLHMIIVLEDEISFSGTPQRAFPTLSIPEFMDQFKSWTTKRYIDGVKSGVLPPFEKHLWQKSYYDHVIRNEDEHSRISKYISDNPKNWQEDDYFLL